MEKKSIIARSDNTITLPKIMPKLFDSLNSLIHYYVAPNDRFVLNTLEMVTPDVYLYRLLRSEGYEHIVFVESEGNKQLIVVYDDASKGVFQSKTMGNAKKSGGSKIELQGMMGEKVKDNEPSQNVHTESKNVVFRYCRQQLRIISTAAEFTKLFTVDFRKALENRSVKTAIVIPLTIFDTDNYCNDAIINTVRKLEKEHFGKNIFLFTMTNRLELLHCFNNKQKQDELHPWVQEISKTIIKEHSENRVLEAIRVLGKKIVLADKYEVDEIANLLFRKILIENNPILSQIDGTKVYTIAEHLRDQCLGEKRYYPNLPFGELTDHLIKVLDSILNEDDIAESLLRESKDERISYIASSNVLPSLLLERAYHLNTIRYKNEGSVEEIQKKFDSFSGEEMQPLIQEIRRNIDYFLSEKQRIEHKREQGTLVEDDEMPFMNMVFMGPPGTGKTTIAKITGTYLKALGVLKSGKFVYTSATKNVQGVVGATAANIRQKAEEAVGGVLFIDEFQGFYEGHTAGNIAENVMREIVSIINDHRSDLCVIVAGYTEGVEKVLDFDDGWKRRFPIVINFKNYSVETLLQILNSIVKGRGETLEDGMDEYLAPIIESRITEDKEKFGNAGYIKDILLPALGKSRSSRCINSKVYTIEDVKTAFPEAIASKMSEKTILKEFDRYIGEEISGVKDSIIGAAEYFLYEKEILNEKRKRGENVSDEDYPYMNLIFEGPPGTGKTSVAKLAAKYFKAKGVLPTSRYVYRSAKQLTDTAVGGTAKKIREAADEARGGVLFIDEFQGFDSGLSSVISKEAMQEIVSITNEYKGKLCLIIAGYKSGVDKVLEFDEGSERRFPRKIEFKNYSIETLMQIFEDLLKDRREEIESEAIPLVKNVLEEACTDLKDRFGNGGFVKDVLLGKLTEAMLKRDAKDRKYHVEDVMEAFPNVRMSNSATEDILKEFDKYIGEEMQDVKKSIIRAADYFLDEKNIIEERKKNGEKVDKDDYPFMNMVFVGGPGTGKTSIAKLTARYFRAKGIMPTSNYVYRSASQLIKGVVGETAAQIRAAANDARGGILFIDEFQGFFEGHTAGNIAENAMREIVSITNENKGQLCLIIAGYKSGVDKVLEFDEGSERRFPREIEFKNYSNETLMQIFDNLLKDRKEEIEPEARPLIESVMEGARTDLKERFGNGGFVKDVLLAKLSEARLERDKKDKVYRVVDVEAAFGADLANNNKPVLQRVSRHLFEGTHDFEKPDDMGFDKQSLNSLVEPAVLLIKTDKGYGTGFLISKEGYALTCNHVIDGAKKIEARVRIPNEGRKSFHDCKLLFTDPNVDMALIKLDGAGIIPILPLAAENRKLEKGEDFILVGYPFGKRTEGDPSLYDGHIASFQTDEYGLSKVTIEGEAKAGNSGSPVVSLTDGRVIGILVGSIDQPSKGAKVEEINFIRPIEYFWKEIVK